jgi:hypothetical protein
MVLHVPSKRGEWTKLFNVGASDFWQIQLTERKPPHFKVAYSNALYDVYPVGLFVISLGNVPFMHPNLVIFCQTETKQSIFHHCLICFKSQARLWGLY